MSSEEWNLIFEFINLIVGIGALAGVFVAICQTKKTIEIMREDQKKSFENFEQDNLRDRIDRSPLLLLEFNNKKMEFKEYNFVHPEYEINDFGIVTNLNNIGTGIATDIRINCIGHLTLKNEWKYFEEEGEGNFERWFTVPTYIIEDAELKGEGTRNKYYGAPLTEVNIAGISSNSSIEIEMEFLIPYLSMYLNYIFYPNNKLKTPPNLSFTFEIEYKDIYKEIIRTKQVIEISSVLGSEYGKIETESHDIFNSDLFFEIYDISLEFQSDVINRLNNI